MSLGTLTAAPVHRWHVPKGVATWWPVAVGLLVLYVPTYRDLAAVFWASENGAPGVVVLATWFWLVWRERAALGEGAPTELGSRLGWACVALGAALYVMGRSQQLYQLEAGSQLVLLPGIALVMLGPASMKRLWFAWLFLSFTVPWPGSFMDALLVPLKEFVSAAVTEVLYRGGLPIARDGVVIYAGPYQLFIADACSGLNQLVALGAIGVLYVYLAGHRSRVRNAILLVAILPIAACANLARVTALVLATYFGGDGLGLALHDYVSYAEIAVAFGGFFVLDAALRAGTGLTRRVR
jgi:exosortase